MNSGSKKAENGYPDRDELWSPIRAIVLSDDESSYACHMI